MLQEFIYNVQHNMFKPLLLFFYCGFLIPILRVKFEFPKVLYQSITIYLLLAIGWHGGEELANLSAGMLGQALGLMLIGFCTNTVIGCLAYFLLRSFTRLRKIDAATVAGYYGSDSAGTFVTCVGVLTTLGISYAAYMPVMLAIMEIPGCLVALYLVAKLRHSGMDSEGNAPDEPGYRAVEQARARSLSQHDLEESAAQNESVLVGAGAGQETHGYTTRGNGSSYGQPPRTGRAGRSLPEEPEHLTPEERARAEREEADIAMEPEDSPSAAERYGATHSGKHSVFSKEMMHEVFLNPGIFLLFGGIAIGFISRLQGEKVVEGGDHVFVYLFYGVLCLFLLEMGMTASQKLKDLRHAGLPFIAYGLLAPNLFASIGIAVLHTYSMCLGQPFEIGTYVLFAVLCGAASYIAVPAVQRMAIPEASPTLPLAASLGLTFSYNVTIGIPVYICIAQVVTRSLPVHGA